MSSSTHIFRRPTASEASAISCLIGSTWAHFFAYSVSASDLAGYLAGPISPSSIERDISDSTQLFLVAIDTTKEGDASIIGAVQLSTNITVPCLKLPKSIHLRRFYIDKSYHGAGLARDLMGAAEELGRREGYESMWLGVWEDNHRAQRFYQKIGFSESGQTEFVMGESRRRDLVLEKRI